MYPTLFALFPFLRSEYTRLTGEVKDAETNAKALERHVSKLGKGLEDKKKYGKIIAGENAKQLKAIQGDLQDLRDVLKAFEDWLVAKGIGRATPPSVQKDPDFKKLLAQTQKGLKTLNQALGAKPGIRDVAAFEKLWAKVAKKK